MSSSIGSSSTSSTFRSPFGFIDRFLSPLRRAIYNAPKCPLPIDLPPPNGTPRFPNNDFSEELARFEKAAKHLLPLLKQLDRPPAHIAALGPDVAAMVSFNEAVAFSRAPQPADLDPLHHHHIHRIEHHITHLLSHLRHETSNLIANANLQNACKCHAETEALEKRLRNLQDEVSRWCRKAFGTQKKVLVNVGWATRGRWVDMSDVTMAWAVESLFWAVVEERWLQAWFPVGLDAEEKKSLEATEERLELCAGHANAESWRACTCDLLSRCSVGTIVAETNKVFSDLDGAFNLVTGSRISRYYRSSFRRILEVTLKLAMDMKCCIPFYEVDKTVEVSDQFDDDKMEAVEDENPASKVVVGIVSRGIVERRFKGDIDIVAWVRKNRVLLRDVEGDS